MFKVWYLQFILLDSNCRNTKAFFTTVEAEEIVEIIICLFLDRRIQGLLVLLSDCMQATVNYFTDQEWCASCENIAKFIACRSNWSVLIVDTYFPDHVHKPSSLHFSYSCCLGSAESQRIWIVSGLLNVFQKIVLVVSNLGALLPIKACFIVLTRYDPYPCHQIYLCLYV